VSAGLRRWILNEWAPLLYVLVMLSCAAMLGVSMKRKIERDRTHHEACHCPCGASAEGTP